MACTCRPENYKWIQEHKLYNLPLPEGRSGDSYQGITHIVVYVKGKKELAFSARYQSDVEGEWLPKLGYSPSPTPHGKHYALFELLDRVSASAVLGAPGTDVFVCSSRWTGFIDAQFFKSPLPECGGESVPNIFAKLKPYYRKWDYAAACNPMQMTFADFLEGKRLYNVPFPPPANPKFSFIDLFAGIGGFRIAMQNCGGQCVFTSEFDPAAQKTYEANFGEVPEGDITKQETHDKIPGEFDIVCAGFPCQAFSLAGKRQGFKDSYKGMSRGTLFQEVVKICENHRPKAVFCENVKGLFIHDRGNTFRIIKGAFEEIGYKFFYQILNSKDFGVPQTRERIYMVAFRNDCAPDKFEFPKPTGKKVCLADIRQGSRPGDEPVSARYYLSDVYVETLRRHRRRHEEAGHGFGYVIRDWDGVSGAIVCGGMGRETNLLQEVGKKTPAGLVPETHIKGHINQEGIRKMTPREWARLQGFPEAFKFVLSDVHLYKQFGNSVSVPVIQAISERIVKHLKKVSAI